jgi:DNA-binding PadR family transcriptional regulator
MQHDPEFAFAWAGDGPSWRDFPARRFNIPRAFMRRFGPGGPRGPRMFGRGDMKFALLGLLAEHPMHGYELIKAFEDRSGGFYAPSPGVIYPTLQLLEDQGWVTSETQDGKKIYTITEAGRTALSAHAAEAQNEWEQRYPPFGRHGPRGPFSRGATPELIALGASSMEVAHLMRQAIFASGGDPERLKKLQAIVDQARSSLHSFLAEQGQRAPSGQSGTSGDDSSMI